jgi:translation elongation factor EF-1beta
VIPTDPNARITSLEEVIKHINESIEVMKKSNEDIASQLLSRKDLELEERREVIC